MRVLLLGPLAALTLCAGLAVAHDDDPKILLQVAPIRPVLSPGWIPAAGVGQPGTNTSSSFEASGLTLQSWLTPGDLGLSSLCNDNWGYVSPSGREYAVQCSEEATVFVEVTDPANPAVVGAIPGPVGLWRDAKVYQEYAYSVSETDGVGVQVIDLTQIDAGTVTLVNTVEGTDTGKTHNVAINEESGYLYRTGGSYHGLRIYDLANPAAPSYVASWDARYVHDAQIVNWSDGRELAFCCSGFNGGWDDTGLTILDVTDKQNITVVAQRYYAGGEYSHQGWLSEDRQYFYLGDELDENGAIFTRTHVFDVSNPDAATYVGAFENSSRSIGHNMYTRDGKLFQANYRSGLRVFDLDQSPTSPPEVAYFDTQPGNDTADFGGTWSVYPYLPSGTILLSDRAEGLFLLRLDPDCDGDGIPDSEELDCNGNGTPDDCESFTDCDGNGIPDECQPDCDGDGTPDACEADCNANGTPDDCESFADCDGNGVPDECQPDTDGDGTIDACELGVNYCGPAVPNSSGLSGVMDATGSRVVADNDLTLVGKQLATNQFGYFLVSDTQGFVANPGGSQGNLCLGGTIGRYVKDVASTGATGSLALLIDLDKLPAPLNVGVNPGETWNFQAWFRDKNPDQTSNFTDGLAITFL